MIAYLDVNTEAAIADLNTIDYAIQGQVQQIVFSTARRYLASVKASTPVGTVKSAKRKPLSTGWEFRPVDPMRVHVANIRPHAHLAAEGWDHVNGDHVPPFVPWIKDAIATRAGMVTEIQHVVDGGVPMHLRALEVSR